MSYEISRLIFPAKLTKQFPTKLETLRAFLYEKNRHSKLNATNTKSSDTIVARIIGKQIQKSYEDAGVKTVRNDIITGKVVKAYKSRLDLLKFSRSQRYSEPFLRKKRQFESEMSEILQVTETKELNRRKNSNKKSNAFIDVDLSDSDDNTNDSEDGKDPDYELPSDLTSYTGNTRKMDLSEIIEAQSRFSYSHRGTAAIVNATLKTFQIPVIIDKSKLQRAEKRKFQEINEVSYDFGGGLYYDSRKDNTMTQTEKLCENGKTKFYRSSKRQEHYSIVSQPNDSFMGFLNVEDGGADAGSTAILKFIDEKNLTNEVNVLGNDGTNTNVGGTGGINHFIEVALKRPLHWFVCLLHANELPLKNLILKLDGKTTSKSTFSGPIGKAIEQICTSKVVDFLPFKDSKNLEEFPDIVYKKLSNDQKYLYRIVTALISGVFPEDLKNLKVGVMCQSRWVTTASRICLLYASSVNPSETLNILTSYIVNVYAPTWFRIKKNELAVDGPKNLFFLIEKSNSIKNDRAKTIVRNCIQRNAFFAHSENVLLAQLASSKMSERNDAVTKIIAVRKQKRDEGVRIFTVPKVNFDAKTWTEMLVWDGPNMTEPPLTLNMTEKELIMIIKTPLEVPRFKCHTQMVERAVKEVTRVSVKAVTQPKQESLVKATLINRAKYPKFDSKKDHVARKHCNHSLKI